MSERLVPVWRVRARSAPTLVVASTPARVGGAVAGWASRRRPGLAAVVVWVAVALTALFRLPFLGRSLGKDEAGFLLVAEQWNLGRGGPSLYGSYWVDRPPLLITIFRVAGDLGGTVPLRLVGIVAAGVSVLAVAGTIRAVGSQVTTRDRAAWAAATAALVAAALLVSPATGSAEVNGELLAAPFVATGIWAAATALTATTRRRLLGRAALAGAAGAAAVLVKQNMADVAVFLVVATLVTVIRGRRSRRTGLRIVLGAATGAAATVAATVAWTVAHGTSPSGVWFALFPFRAEVNAVLAVHPSAHDAARWTTLTSLLLASGLALVVPLLALAALPRRHRAGSFGVGNAVVAGLAAALAYDGVSIEEGGSYWSHYLVQLIVPTALLAGLATLRRPGVGRAVSAVLVAAAAVAVGPTLQHAVHTAPNPIGAVIARSARPGDTIVTAWGHADVNQASGLPSPYPYLWSLPARVLDPGFRQLTTLMNGPQAPTWFVSHGGRNPFFPGARTTTVLQALHAHYHRFAVVHGSAIYLHDGRPLVAGPA